MKLTPINQMSEQKLRRQYVKSITKESPELHEFSSWTRPPLSQETVDFALFSDKMNLINYDVMGFEREHLYFGLKTHSRITKILYILSGSTRRGNELNDK